MIWRHKKYALIAILFINFACYGQKQDSISFVEVDVGFKPGNYVGYFFQLSLEKKFIQHNSVAFSLDYSFAKIQGGSTISNPGSTTLNSFPIKKRYLFANINWRPIRTKKHPFSWLVIGGGIGYYKKWYYDRLVYSAPGIKNFLGVNYTFYDKFTTGFRAEFFYFYDFKPESNDQFLVDLQVTISLGIRFVKVRQ